VKADVAGLRADVDARLVRFEEKIITEVTSIVRIEHERTREMLQKATEGYAATLARIDRDAAEHKRAHEAHLAMHDKVLKNHVHNDRG
jgi:hypothetical protein